MSASPPSLHVHRHSDRVMSVDAFLTPQECADLVALADRHGFVAAQVRTEGGARPLPHIRNNERAQFAAPLWTRRLWERLEQLALPQLDGQAPAGLPADLRFYRYSPGERFKMHKDGPWEEHGLRSKLTLLVYLNQGFGGGDTDFRDFRVTPSTGSALIFMHDTWHEGVALTTGVKYVLRSDILYRPLRSM